MNFQPITALLFQIINEYSLTDYSNVCRQHVCVTRYTHRINKGSFMLRNNYVHRINEVHYRPNRQMKKLGVEDEEPICTSEMRNQI